MAEVEIFLRGVERHLNSRKGIHISRRRQRNWKVDMLGMACRQPCPEQGLRGWSEKATKSDKKMSEELGGD